MKKSDSQTCQECGGTGRVSNPRDILGTETCLACAGRPKPGDPFPCPNCGADDWRVSYPESVHQDVIVVVREDGTPEVEDYTGNTGIYSDGSGDNEELRCNECDYTFTWGSHVFMTTAESERRDKIEAVLTALKTEQDGAAESDLGMDMNVVWGCVNALVDLAKPAVATT